MIRSSIHAWLYRSKRWIYAGEHPNWIAKISNWVFAVLASWGVFPNFVVTLEVTGRKSGRTVSLPVVVAIVNRERYLVSMLGEHVNWVQNVRAAGGRAALRSGGREEVHLEEVAASQRALILKVYLQRAPGARPHVPVDKDAPLAEFEKVAPDFPAFRVVSMKNARSDVHLKNSTSAGERTITDEHITPSVIPWRRLSSLKFILLVFGLSLPFWVISAISKLELMPGLPFSGLIAVCPGLAATLLVYHEHRTAGVIALLKRAFDVRRVKAKIWYLPTLLLMPAVVTLAYGAQRLLGTPVPIPYIPLLSVLTMSVVFFPFALSEELGWMGYSIDPLQQRWGALQASLILGGVWALWHYPGLVQEHRSIDWIAWWSLGTLAERVIMVWLYNNTGRSVCLVALFHMTDNLTWQLYPINGSFYDPRIIGVILMVITVIIIVGWSPATLIRSRHRSFNEG